MTLDYLSLSDNAFHMLCKRKQGRVRYCWFALWDRMAYEISRHCGLSAVQTSSSLPISPLIWSFTSPQFNFLLSSGAWNPKWSDKSHQTFFCRISGCLLRNSPRLNIKSSSASASDERLVGVFSCRNRVITAFFLSNNNNNNNYSFIVRFLAY